MPASKQTGKTRKKNTRSSASAASAKRVAAPATMSLWMRNVIAVGIVLSFSLIFYWFFIRPYSYRWKPCHGMKWYGVCMPGNYQIHGVDMSHYQGKIDWGLLAKNRSANFPLHFIFLKATEGGDYSDTTFAAGFAKAKEYGFIRGAYHFFIPQTDPVKQADFFIRTARLQPGDLPPVLDVETKGGKSREELQAAVKIWLDRVESHYGRKPILYTSYKFKKKYLDNPVFNAYPYWIAHYYVDTVRYEGKWQFWQHTDVGTVPGIEKEVDLNIFNGTLEQLKALTLSPTDSIRLCR